MKKLFLILMIMAVLAGCFTTATITDPNGYLYVYEGPKDVDMSIKQGNTEITFSGKTESFWQGMLKFLLMKSPDITVVK